jgi:hypothetical protein
MANDISSKTITLDPIYITASVPKPAPKAQTKATDSATEGAGTPPAGDGFDRGAAAGAKLQTFTGASRYGAAPKLGDVAQGERNLHHGQQGKSVKYGQELLQTAGFGPLAADGKFGPKTEAAVRAYQAAHGLEVDGKLGIKTLQSLHAGNATSVKQESAYKELAPDVQAALVARYEGATTDLRQRRTLALLVDELPSLPKELQHKALDAAAAPSSLGKLSDMVSDYTLGLSDAATLSKRLDALIAER